MQGMAIALWLCGAGCSWLIDHSAVQCRTDADCEHFQHHPYCQDSLCVPSGLGPAQCFFATPDNPPTTPEEYLNQCSDSFLPGSRDNPLGECLSFARPVDPGAGVKDPPVATAPPAKPATAPTAFCKDLAPGGSVLYLSGSSNFQPLLKELAPAVVQKAGVMPVFRITTSCTGIRSMNSLSPTYATDHLVKDPVTASESYAQIFLGDGGPGVSCLLGSSGVPVDVGESEIYPESCGPPANSPEDVSEGLGPILPIVFAVPQVSVERAISFEAARQVFGGGGGVPPWEDPGYIYVRGSGTATLRLVAQELQLMPTKIWGIDQGSAGAMAVNLAGITDLVVAQTAIGIIGADFYDSYRGSLKALAFQAQNQDCAYVPDSSLTSKDKINVRDGHYPLWGRIHFFTARANGLPVSDAAQRFVFLLTSSNLDPEILDAFIDASFVPACAMKVKRETELGDLSNDDPPPFSCGCAFDARVNPNKSQPPPGCTPCTTNGECLDANRPSCNYGFCEEVQ
jgi:ABC-type phosphate transport system substrate-binding protein